MEGGLHHHRRYRIRVARLLVHAAAAGRADAGPAAEPGPELERVLQAAWRPPPVGGDGGEVLHRLRLGVPAVLGTGPAQQDVWRTARAGMGGFDRVPDGRFRFAV